MWFDLRMAVLSYFLTTMLALLAHIYSSYNLYLTNILRASWFSWNRSQMLLLSAIYKCFGHFYQSWKKYVLQNPMWNFLYFHVAKEIAFDIIIMQVTMNNNSSPQTFSDYQEANHMQDVVCVSALPRTTWPPCSVLQSMWAVYWGILAFDDKS